MRSRVAATICALTASCVGGWIAAQAPSAQDDLERARDSVSIAVAGNVMNPEVYDTNGFHVTSSDNAQLGADFSPDGQRFQMVSLSAPAVFDVVVEKGRPMSAGGGLAILHRDSGRPLLSVSDANGDGALDGLTYSKVDEDGTALLDVVDYEADGQPDLRINFADGFSELWHVDRWYRIESRDGRRGIVLNGMFVALRQDDNRLRVP
jgi:hypothetical protein